jgi:nitrogenase molybdenum-iron protein NifN
MASVEPSTKNVTINPLKMSQPLGGATAFMGLDRCLPMLHAAQGCTAFALVLLVRHFREAIPFQTTAMSEVTTILGGADNLEQAIVNIVQRAHPEVIGICSNGLIEARGEDVQGDLKAIRSRHPELAGTTLIHARTPDYKGGFQDGWAAAVEAIINQMVEPLPGRSLRQVNVLAGCHLTPADIEEIRDTVDAFGLAPIILPDISGSLDGHVEDTYVATTQGGTTLTDIRAMSRSVATLALGQQMEPAARLLEKRCGIPVEVFSRLTGLIAWDNFIAALARISGRPVPQAIRRRRSQLIDAMLDGHFFFGEKKIAIAADPDLLVALSCFLNDMGATITAAVTTSQTPALAAVPAKTVIIGDLDDLEARATGSDLLIAHSHGARVAARLGVPFLRAGFPNFDRLGAAHQLSVGYLGTRSLIFEVGNLFIAAEHERAVRQPQGGMHAAPANH